MLKQMIFLSLALTSPLLAKNSKLKSALAPAASCTAIPAPVKVALPHVMTSGAPGKAVIQAIDALLAAQQPPVPAGQQTYALREVSCRNISTPSAQGFSCSLDIAIDGRVGLPITTSTPSDLAENLSSALIGAGADDCNDFAHGDFLRLTNVAIEIPTSKIEFDDGSNYGLPAIPNVSVAGAEGLAVLRAFEAAGVNDCDPSRTVFIVCNRNGETPQCSRTFFPLEKVGGSVLANICTPTPAVGPTVQIAAAEAQVLWNAILKAAAVSGYKPANGTLEQTTIINAREFTWDGMAVAFGLFADNPQLPPPPASSPR